MSLDTAAVKAISRSITAKFNNAAEAYDPFYTRLCITRPSDRRTEEYGFAGNVKGMQELLGEVKYSRLRGAGFTLENKEFADGLEIEQVDFKDDKVGIYDDTMRDMGTACVRHPDELLFSLINNAASLPCWDSQNFVDTDHEWGDSGSQSNKLTYNIAGSSNDPTADECRAIFQAGFSAIAGFKRDNGLPFIGPVIQDLAGLIMLVPSVALWQSFSAALYATANGSGATNLIVAKPADVICCPSLTAADCVYVVRTGTAYMPFVYQDREPYRVWWNLEEAMRNPTVPYKLTAYARRNMGYFAWWNFVRIQMN